MSTSAPFEELKKISGISDFSKLTTEDLEKLLKLIGEQRLKEAHVKALLENAPLFLGCAKEALSVIGKAAAGAKESQKSALAPIAASVANISKVLEILAEKAESDESRIKIVENLIEAGKLYLEFLKISESMNKDNNAFWLKLNSIVAFVVGGLIVAFVGRGKGGGSNKA